LVLFLVFILHERDGDEDKEQDKDQESPRLMPKKFPNPRRQRLPRDAGVITIQVLKRGDFPHHTYGKKICIPHGERSK